MTKTRKIMYWVFTVWLAFGMVSSGLVQLLHVQTEVDFMASLGYPAYFLTILGAWKILGAVAILVPRFPVLKEWAYAGFFFTMSGAVFSHVGSHDTFGEMVPALSLLILTVISWSLRPASRKVV